MADSNNKSIQSSENVTNALLESMQIIAKSAIKDLGYDKTIIGIIKSKSDKNDYSYNVTYQDSTITAFAYAGDAYYNGDNVYIQVPQNDFTKQKFILGRVEDTNVATSTFNFKQPFDDFIGLNNLTNPGLGSFSYLANNPQDGFIETLPNNNATANELLYESQSQHLVYKYPYAAEGTSDYTQQLGVLAKAVGSTKLGIEFNVKALLGSYNLTQGKYGLKIFVVGQTKTTSGLSSVTTLSDALFTNDDMYGNTYAYLSPYVQQKIFDISNFISLNRIEIYFYQDWNFRDVSGNLIDYYDSQSKSNLDDNIFYSDLNVYLGYTSSDLTEDKLFLYTYDNLSFGEEPLETSESRRKELDTRQLKISWAHKEDSGFRIIDEKKELPFHYEESTTTDVEGNEITITSSTPTYDAEIWWYRYNSNTLLTNAYGGLHWEIINDKETISTTVTKVVDGVTTTEIVESEQYKTTEFAINVIPSINQNTEKYKAVIHYNGTFYVCENIVQFTNITDVKAINEGLASNDTIIIKGFIEHTDAEGNISLAESSSVGNFYVYDENNRSLSNEEGSSFSSLTYYLQLWIKNNGEYCLLGQSTEDAAFKVEWDEIHNLSMISSFGDVSERSSFYNKYMAKVTKAFTINDYYSAQYMDNTINVTVTLGQRIYHISKELFFGQSGSKGTESTLTIDIVDPTGNKYLLIGDNFQLRCRAYDCYHNEISQETLSTYSITWSILGMNEDGGPAISNYSSDAATPYIFTGRLDNDKPPIVTVTVNSGIANYPISVTRGLLISSDSNYVTQNDFNLPNKIEFKSDGSKPEYSSEKFNIINISTDIYEYPTWYINENKYLYLRSLAANGYKEYSLQCADIDNSNNYNNAQWIDTLGTFAYYTYIYTTNANGNILIAQAIPYTQNLYSSSLVNSWDGKKLNIDEDGNSIMGRMIAAGTKNSNGQFTGVMMGDWSSKGDSSIDMPGLYGFASGAQTFGFKKDGTGFIGASGNGRIEFDGKQALISNADKSCYINLNPTKQKLNGILTSTNRGYSQYFLYSKVSKNDSTVLSDSSQFYDWTNEFSQDDVNDYYIVDPNYGVFTSGSIIAKNGKIANWIITKDGLSQFFDNPVGSSEKGKYVYLGYSAMSKEEYDKQYTIISSEYSTRIDAENTYYSQSYSGLANTYNTDKTTLSQEQTDRNNILKQDYDENILTIKKNYYVNVFDVDGTFIGVTDDLKVTQKYREDLAQLSAQNQIILDQLETKYNEDLVAANNKYIEDLQNAMGDSENAPVLFTFDPMHDMNYGDAAKVVRDLLTTVFANIGINKTAEEYKTEIHRLIPTVMNIENYAKADHYHYNIKSDGTITIIPNVQRTGWTYTIGPLTNSRISLEPGPRIYSRETQYGTANYYDYTNCKSTLSYNMMTAKSTQIYIYDTLHSTATNHISTSYTVPTWYADSADINNNTEPYSYARLEYCQQEYDIAYTKCKEAYNVQIEQIIDASEGFIDPEVAAALLDAYNQKKSLLGQTYINDCAAQNEEFNKDKDALDTGYATSVTSVMNQYEKECLAEEQAYNLALKDSKYKYERDLAAKVDNYEESLKQAQKTHEANLLAIDVWFSTTVQQIYKNDVNKYAMYVGTDPINNNDTIANRNIPLFSVRWDGAMQARKGLIGENNPWVISDDGIVCTWGTENDGNVPSLQSEKNYGTIFLGNPEKDASWTNEDIKRSSPLNYTQQITGYDADGNVQISENTWNIYEERYVDSDGNEITGNKDSAVCRIRKEYLGLRSSDNSNVRYTRYLKNDNAFVLYAGDNQINFGVNMRGYLFSQSGKIANWDILTDKLQSIKYDSEDPTKIVSSIVLDTEKNKISFFNDSTVIWGDGRIYLGQSNGDSTSGYIYLANYMLKGTISDSALGGINSDTTGTKSTTFTEESTEDAGNKYVSGSFTIPALDQTTLGELKTVSVNIYSPSSFSIVDTSNKSGESQTNTGVKIVAGSTNETDDTQNRAVIIYPTGHDNAQYGNAVLGLTTARWNLMGNYIDCLNIKTNNITAESIYMEDEGKKALLSTQPWVLNKLDAVYKAINAVKSASSGGIGSPSFGGGAWGGINNISSLLSTIFNGKNWVHAYVVDYVGGKLRLFRTYSNITYNASGSGGINDTGSVAETKTEHQAFDVTLTANELIFSGEDTIRSKMPTKAGTAVSDNGNITIPIQNSSSTTLFSINFNQADTAYYKAHAYSSISSGGVSAWNNYSDTVWNVDVKMVDGTTKREKLTININHAYTEGEAAGAASVTHSISVSSVKTDDMGKEYVVASCGDKTKRIYQWF